MITEDGVKIQNGFKIRGIEPPDLRDYDPSTRKLFWSWVVELGLKRKDKELSQGLDKDGKPLRAITEYTRQHRKSAMTPSGKGDPAAPPLTPGLQKSRTRSLLAGKAFSTHADFFWRYDAWTGDSWAVVLSYQAAKGRDVFGLSKAGTAAVKAQSWAKWARWKEGRVRATPQSQPRQIAVPQFGRYQAEHIEHGVSTSGGTAAFIPGKFTGFTTPEERRKFFSQTAAAKLPGRAANPPSKHPDVGPKYNRLLTHVWGGQTMPGRGGSPPAPPKLPPKPPPKPPKKPAPKPPVPPPKPAPAPPPPPQAPPLPTGPRFNDLADVERWAKNNFPKAAVIVEGIPVESWAVIADELDYFVAKAPALADRLYKFGSLMMDKNDVAAAVPGSGSALHFHPPAWQDIKKLGEQLAKDSKSGWHPRGVEDAGAAYYVTHEVGHLMDGLTEQQHPKVHDTLMKQFRDPTGATKWSKDRGRVVSEYAATNELEMWAESFAAARWQKGNSPLVVRDFRTLLNP